MDFVINRLFMKLFKTDAIDTVKVCQEYFDFELPSVVIEKRKKTFYRAMHFSAKRGIAIACCLSVCPYVRLSVCP